MNRSDASAPGDRLGPGLRRDDGQVGEAGRVRFVLDGKVHSAADVAPTKSVLAYVRENLRRTGTKEGCAEGDCGACTVVVAELAGDDVRVRTVNACLQLLPFLDGKVLYTVESLGTQANTQLTTRTSPQSGGQPGGQSGGQPGSHPGGHMSQPGGLHPAQQAMVSCHGSQCGFCTPGFVMSLFGLYVDHSARGTTPDDRAARTALAGNLCRCTGYRPILDAARRMFELPPAPFDREALRAQLRSVARTQSLDYTAAGGRFSAPRTLTELHALRAQHPEATLVAGNTDVGLWINKQLREIGHLICTGEVAELRSMQEMDNALRIGAAVSLEDAYAALAEHYPGLVEMWERFASPPIRNAGTMGGNVANGSPIGDSMPALIALQSRVVLSGVNGARTLPLEDLYVGYQKKAMAADEIVEAIEVPLPVAAQRFRTYKISKRYDSDISAVCGAFALRLENDAIADCRIAYGGMAAIPRRAPQAEAALRGRAWEEATLDEAIAALAHDFQPLSDMRASAGYRMDVARNLLRRFWLETRADNPLSAAEVSVFAAAA